MPKSAAKDTAAWDTAIELRHVTKTFLQRRSGVEGGKRKKEEVLVRALDDVSFTVERGAFVAYAGPNGAGKSTTFKLLCGLLGADSGRVRTLGMDPMRERIPLMRRCGVFFGNRSELWWDHPVLASFEWKQAVWDIPKDRYQKMLDEVVELLELRPFLHTFVRELSLGQRMRADLGLLLLHEPELILLDEPTLGLDVLAKRQMIGFLKRYNRERRSTILVTSHDMDDLAEMAQRIVMVSQGRIAFDGGIEALRAVAGDRRTLWVTGPESAPALRGTEYVGSEGLRHTYLFDTDQVDLARLLAEISSLPDLADVGTGEVPMEAVIAELYVHWGCLTSGSDVPPPAMRR